MDTPTSEEETKKTNFAKVATVTKEESVRMVKWFLEPMRSETVVILRLLAVLLRLAVVLTVAFLMLLIILSYRLIFQ